MCLLANCHHRLRCSSTFHLSLPAVFVGCHFSIKTTYCYIFYIRSVLFTFQVCIPFSLFLSFVLFLHIFTFWHSTQLIFMSKSVSLPIALSASSFWRIQFSKQTPSTWNWTTVSIVLDVLSKFSITLQNKYAQSIVRPFHRQIKPGNIFILASWKSIAVC